MKGATNMKKLLKLTGITIALTAIGVGVRAIKEKNKYRLEGKQLRKEISRLQKLFNQCDKF